jgi:hypothetical protein
MVGQAPEYGVPDANIRTFRYRVDTLRMAWNFRTQGAMVKNHPDDFHPVQREYLRPFELFNVTVVPLVLEGRIIGMIGTVSAGLSRRGTRSSCRWPDLRVGVRRERGQARALESVMHFTKSLAAPRRLIAA